jgi:hypothetical protein
MHGSFFVYWRHPVSSAPAHSTARHERARLELPRTIERAKKQGKFPCAIVNSGKISMHLD